jgi:hypothetical protein
MRKPSTPPAIRATKTDKCGLTWEYKGQTITLIAQNLGKYILYTWFISEGGREVSGKGSSKERALCDACDEVDMRLESVKHFDDLGQDALRMAA